MNNYLKSCPRIWDPVEARISSCFAPFVCAFPLIVALVVIGLRSLRRWHQLPKVLRPFVTEAVGITEELPGNGKEHHFRSYQALILLSACGLFPSIFSLIYDPSDLSNALSTTTWVVTLVLIVVERPRAVSFLLLPLFGALLLSTLVLAQASKAKTEYGMLLSWLGPMASLAGMLIILLMPLRDPRLPRDQISPVFTAPDPKLRSPEDNLTLLQFMTVSWMTPLISEGYSRQLHDRDVWLLGHEFQHKALHENFRKLNGTMFWKVVTANALDLIMVAALGALELVAELSTPILLQQLLRSMGAPNRPFRPVIVYAALTLAVRAIEAQSGGFSLWYSRRSFERSRGQMITTLYEKMLKRKVTSHQSTASTDQDSEDTRTEHEKQTASMGKVINLMRGDVYEVAQRFWESASLTNTPLSIIFSTILIWKLLGWPCLVGAAAIIVSQVINTVLARTLVKWETRRRAATDVKLNAITQFVEAIRHLRWYGWQDAWLTRILDARQRELNLRIVTGLWSLLIIFTEFLASGMFPVLSFYAYTYLAGQPLRIDIAFPALELFGTLEASLFGLPHLFTSILNAYVAVRRLDAFMNEPDKPEEALSTLGTGLELRNASFSWPGTNTLVLHEINVTFKCGLNVVYGKVASGKTALLLALLGELDRVQGEVLNPISAFGYCSQTPWLQNMSIRDNIVFSAHYDEDRYRQVLSACALTEDLATFKHGDLSHIGENGIGLSGGQKARVALARAVYSQCEILLLDDPLSALDQQTAEIVVEKCFNGPLLAGRTIVLITHRTDLCLHLATQLVQVSDGRAQIQDSSSQAFESVLMKQGVIGLGEVQDENTVIADKFIEPEHRATGGVHARVYWEYIKAGKLPWWAACIIVIVGYRLTAVARAWFLKQWGESYSDPPRFHANILAFNNPLERFPSPEQDIKPWLVAFFAFAMVQAFLYVATRSTMLVIVYISGRQMFRDIMHRISYANFRFYDVTPVGRLMNRLTSDIGTIDGNISERLQNVAWYAIAWTTSLLVIASITPIFLAFSLALTLCFVLIFLRFLPTSQSLRRLEMVSLSPLLSNFGALSEGLTTVRAFGAQQRFQDRVISVTDDFQKMDHFYWSLQAWLTYRFDLLSAVSTFLLTILALVAGVSPGLTAFVLVTASRFVSSTHQLCKQYGSLQMDFVSVERVVEMLHLEQEPAGIIDPPAWWPSFDGDIVLEDVTVRYAPHLEPALKSVSLRVKAGSNTAIMGRTGSGKSTLALSLLAIVPPESGRITIDNVDISKVNTQALRSRITFLAQEPLLFPGTMRQNLDPLGEHTDFECEEVLATVARNTQSQTENTSSDMETRVAQNNSQSEQPPHSVWTPATQIEGGGRNLSQGQRQLVGMARALLRKSPIIILDEATASIDLQTALQIQGILRTEMAQSTVITIAHRAEAVKGADRIVRMSEGRIVDE